MDTDQELFHVRNYRSLTRSLVLILYREIKAVRETLKRLLKIHPHRVWGPPVYETFLAKATTNLEECFKRIPVSKPQKTFADSN